MLIAWSNSLDSIWRDCCHEEAAAKIFGAGV